MDNFDPKQAALAQIQQAQGQQQPQVGDWAALKLGALMPNAPAQVPAIPATLLQSLVHPELANSYDWWRNLAFGGQPKQALAGSKSNQEVVSDPDVMPQY